MINNKLNHIMLNGIAIRLVTQSNITKLDKDDIDEATNDLSVIPYEFILMLKVIMGWVEYNFDQFGGRCPSICMKDIDMYLDKNNLSKSDLQIISPITQHKISQFTVDLLSSQARSRLPNFKIFDPVVYQRKGDQVHIVTMWNDYGKKVHHISDFLKHIEIDRL